MDEEQVLIEHPQSPANRHGAECGQPGIRISFCDAGENHVKCQAGYQHNAQIDGVGDHALAQRRRLWRRICLFSEFGSAFIKMNILKAGQKLHLLRGRVRHGGGSNIGRSFRGFVAESIVWPGIKNPWRFLRRFNFAFFFRLKQRLNRRDPGKGRNWEADDLGRIRLRRLLMDVRYCFFRPDEQAFVFCRFLIVWLQPYWIHRFNRAFRRRKVEFQGIGISAPAPSRAMLLQPRNDFLPPGLRIVASRETSRRLAGGTSGNVVSGLFQKNGCVPPAVGAGEWVTADRAGHLPGCEFARSGKRCKPFCFSKSGHGNLPISGCMRPQLQFVITAGWLCHLFLAVPLVTSQALPQEPPAAATSPGGQGSYCHAVLTGPPVFSKGESGKASSASRMPISREEPVTISARQCESKGDEYSLHGDVQIQFQEYTFRGGDVAYNNATGEARAEGGAALDGGTRDIHLTASHATYNIRNHTGKFYDVAGTTGARFKGKNITLTSSSPIAFTGKLVEQTGPEEYVLHHGSVTSCELPHPKWTFNAGKIILRVGDSAKVYNSTFRLKGVPVLYLPYANPPVERLGRQSGFLVPNIGTSNTSGTILGDSFYWVINRSADATLGGEYLSKRGWALQDNFRAVPSSSSYLNVNYFQVLDRGISGLDAQGNPTTINQGGEDVKVNAEGVFANKLRGVASVEYLSSFVFRLAFTENFSQAVNSEVNSSAFLTRSLNAYSLNAFASRYQNFQSTTADDVITILHVPGVESYGIDQRILGSPFYGGYDVDAEGLRRSDPGVPVPGMAGVVGPGFTTPGVVGRFDIAPDISLPLHFHGWGFRPELVLDDTVYTQQQIPASPNPIPTHNVLNRRMIEGSFTLSPPVLSKVFSGTIAGRKIKHTIAPRMVYRYTNGLEDFFNIIRFDLRDVYSNTNEVEYSLLQRLYLKHAHDDCSQRQAGLSLKEINGQLRAVQPAVATPSGACAPAGADEFLSWELKQKYFLDPNFGGAVVTGQRNVFFTTVTFSGIAFLTQPRHFSPIVSLLRLRTTSNSDLGWELDYDTVSSRINSNTFYTTYHFGNFFVGASEAYLRNQGQSAVGSTGQSLPPCVPDQPSQPQCIPQSFNQARALLGFGSPGKHGWSAAGNAGYDFGFHVLQYAAAQTAYNWDCCGFSFEYRRFSLGTVRNENQFRFAFTLANIGTFGNLRRQTRLF